LKAFVTGWSTGENDGLNDAIVRLAGEVTSEARRPAIVHH
jgi:hypothetical protein